MAFPAWRNQSLVAAAFLVLQLLIPLRYYLGDSGDDERFTWRMFSTRRLHRCRVRVEEARRDGDRVLRERVDLRRDIQVGWISMLQRNRPQVVERYLGRRCTPREVERAIYLRSCIRADGVPLPGQRVVMRCATGAVTRDEVAR